ncbi:prepilin-type N-terminal cleavage/methylation domain-containing protein [Vibrio sp. S4M6]|uniref:PilW family protein n=1 Tax=Vibrio sinus TaxID=2946865 RepID=UPI00202A18C7|nr:prepilin-type N-terminal cleavage/methylation domain-containing protein [Vibrio sinus]MCL9780534.1 prepilin-type N-terminal cleavage/methylation domain-containing protein [Vibrio sinus]
MNAKGFTLIEMILTIIVGGILVLGLAGFVEIGMKGYKDSIERQRLQTQAKFVLEKMSREIRHSVPNIVSNTAVSSADSCVSFYPIDYAGFYATVGDDIQFLVGSSGASSSDIIDASRSLIINPTTYADTANAFSLTSPTVSLSGSTYIISGGVSSLSSNSVADRQYIYSSQVSYCVYNSSGQVTRNGIQVAENVVSGAFEYLPANMQRGGLVHIDLTFSQDGESTNYQQDVQVLNVP